MVQLINCDAAKLPLEDKSVDLVFGSPPYAGKGTRYNGVKFNDNITFWVEMMVSATKEALRVSSGPVCWVVNSHVKASRYFPSVEFLITRLHYAGIHLERSCIWHKNSPPNRRDWFGNDYETILVAKHPGPVPYFNWEAVAEPPKYKAGGRFRQRDSKGERRLGSEYPTNKLTRPRDVLRFTIGGGHMGHELAHENEAPFPMGLADHFIKVLCKHGGTVLDPFCGSGTTGHAALINGRNFIGCDIRPGKGGIDTAMRRLADVQNQLKIIEEQRNPYLHKTESNTKDLPGA
jgi:DNA modification methylase